MKFYRLQILMFCCLGSFLRSFAQELPPIVKYQPSIYGAGTQNWMISQSQDNFMYFANNEGLLEFNGSNWKLYKSPNETIIRSVKVFEKYIYTGCYMEFGYWLRQDNGALKYTSLSAAIKVQLLDDEQFWNVHVYENWVVFQSLNRLYIYDIDKKTFKIISTKSAILKSFRTQNSIYFQIQNEGLFEIENGSSKLISKQPQILENKIVNVFSLDDGLIIQTQFNGLFRLINGNLTKFTTEIDAILKNSSVYSCQILKNGDFAIGTVSNGLYLLDNQGRQKYHITQNKGLSNNTVLSLFEDNDSNLWVGLDNGINCINLQSPVKSFSDDTGILGTVYASIVFNNKLYIGTNQGLFFKTIGTNNDFQIIGGTKGQVWSLFDYQNTLFCGHDSGTFVVNGGFAKNIYAQSGTWKFSSISSKDNLILQGNYRGFSVLQKSGNDWIFRNKIKGFNYSSKYFEIVGNQIFVSHEYKGIFRFDINGDFTNATNLLAFKTPSKGKHASLIKYDGNIYYAYSKGIFVFNKVKNSFEKDDKLSKLFDHNQYTSGKMTVDASNKLWLFSKNYIYQFSKNKLAASLKQNSIPIPSTLSNAMRGYENVSQLSNSDYLIGTTDGYYTININDLSFKKYNVLITTVGVNKIDQNSYSANLYGAGSFAADENNIIIGFTVPAYNKYISTEYQYFLEGFQESWSDWNAKPSVAFKNLPSGDYVFRVRARIANVISEKVATYSFSINKPWYKTNVMMFLYLLIFLVSAFYINRAYEKYYQNQKQKLIDENNRLLEFNALENEKQLMMIRNEELSNDVVSKNRELAVSTMSLIKKDELLTLIKDDLKKSGEENSSRSIKSAISTITRNINQDDSWNAFKEAFDNADKDFLKKAKASHSSLTPNDLRLCAYLRLNLSSKEIAPLLNISVRSVEIKRYRLRKKMELSHEQGLVEYILSI